MSAPVAIAIVSHDSADDLDTCLRSVGALDPLPAEVVVVDCASSDGSAELARRALDALSARVTVELIPLGENVGFAGGTNRAIARSRSPWILTLNPDATPESDFLGRLLERAGDPRAARAGALAAKLTRRGEPVRLDACGIRLTRSWRHLDRGSGEIDRGQYARPERVFGATGAASLWRREALLDVAFAEGPFDESFHSYREDAELCFRLQERLWDVVYEPAARATHARRVLPERRRGLPAAVNRRSLTNRYRLRIGHQSCGNFWRTLLWTAPRDLGALVWVTALERGSFGAYVEVWRERAAILRRRAEIAGRRTAPAGAVERWLSREAEPL